MESKTKRTYLFFALRVIIATLLLAGIIASIYWAAFRSYSTVAEWKNADSHDVLIMDGEHYRLVGALGQDGLTASDFAINKTIGCVKDDETVTQGSSSLAREHTYVLYSVKNQTNALLLLEPDGSHSLYFREIAQWNDGNGKTFSYNGKTYDDIGLVTEYGSTFEGYLRLGFVSRDSEAAHGATMMYNVKNYPYLFVVEEEDGQPHLYCRRGEDRPLTLAEKA